MWFEIIKYYALWSVTQYMSVEEYESHPFFQENIYTDAHRHAKIHTERERQRDHCRCGCVRFLDKCSRSECIITIRMWLGWAERLQLTLQTLLYEIPLSHICFVLGPGGQCRRARQSFSEGGWQDRTAQRPKALKPEAGKWIGYSMKQVTLNTP